MSRIPDFTQLPWRSPEAGERPSNETDEAWRTPDGIDVQGSYGPADLQEVGHLQTMPGLPPFLGERLRDLQLQHQRQGALAGRRTVGSSSNFAEFSSLEGGDDVDNESGVKRTGIRRTVSCSEVGSGKYKGGAGADRAALLGALKGGLAELDAA